MTKENTTPKYLYKYQKFDNYTIENLKDHAIWFSKPATFDDPYDCAVKIERLGLIESDIEKFLAFWKKEGTLLNKTYDAELADIMKQDFGRVNFIQNINKAFEEMRIGFLNNYGIACFSETNKDLLMWSLYADGHKGLCLEFDKNYHPFDYAFKVDYQTRIPTVDFVDSFISFTGFENDKSRWEEVFVFLQKLLLTKAKCWEYQKEWRILQDFNSRKAIIDFSSLTGVYFGIKMQSEDQKNIMSLIKGENTFFYKMKKDDCEFKLDWEKIK